MEKDLFVQSIQGEKWIQLDWRVSKEEESELAVQCWCSELMRSGAVITGDD